MSIIITVLLLGIIVFIHEFGHFITAKMFHMPVLEFAGSMGPKLISKVKTTVYSIRAIPFGGFVSIDGMEVEAENEVENGFNTQNPTKHFTFYPLSSLLSKPFTADAIYHVSLSTTKCAISP